MLGTSRRRVVSKSAPADLNTYLAAEPAMSLEPLAPFAPCEPPGVLLAADQSMSMEESTQALLERELEKAEILVRFQHALDQTYRRLRDVGRADWERLIGADPADACVTVRIHGDRSPATRGSGFLNSRGQVSRPDSKASVPHFAH